ncbi:MAG: hypothetical protein PHC38_10445 [Weeksellaceae bacterium]|jgi:hypothetical protein|nr:hypothetical protein [Weeksellaceae bacterium]
MNSLTITNGRADKETGLAIRQSYKASSGLNYQTGLREFGDLKIIEGVAKGTASIFLVSLMVLDQNGKLIFDGEVKKQTNYSREYVRRMVRDGLLTMLREAAEMENKFFDELQAIEIIDQKLKSAYFEQSYKAVIKWAVGLGINITSL